MTEREPRVFTIPPGASFLDTLARALLDGTLVPGFTPGRDPLALSTATILVPTRRAARALAATMAAHAGAPAILLPRILPLGGLDAIETDLAFSETALDDPLASDLPDAIAPLPRRLILTTLILQWAASVRGAIVAVDRDGTRRLHPHEELLVATSAADAFGLAGDLATLSDELIAEGIDWARIAPLGTEAYDHYWRITLDFLSVVVERWPAILAARGEVDAVRRQAALIDTEIARLQGHHGGPVIVAGSTGSSPATARLIAAIARLPQGAVVLPGLDQDLDEAGWAAIVTQDGETASHPQAALRRLLGTIGIGRAQVRPLGDLAPGLATRNLFVGEAMRPASTTETWQGFAAAVPPLFRAAALDGVTVIEAADEREEGLALAIALREALEGPGTAILVTPDRALGRRVREELSRWSIDVDLSSGDPLGTTPAGALARLALDAALQDLAPVEVLALLAHPLVRLGRSRVAVASLAQVLEVAILRGVLPPGALHDPAGLVEATRARRAKPHAAGPLKRLTDADLSALGSLCSDVAAALAPLRRLPGGTPLPAWVEAHATVVECLTAMPDGTALSGIDGHALTGLFDELGEAPEAVIALDGAAYAALFDRLAAETPVRGPNRSHPRLKILGLLEARLLTADLVLLGGLDEGTWPPPGRTDAFLNRPMRASLGLAPPERRIGQTAHDLAMQLGAPRVILSRARKREGTPTVPSRFLLRMAALGGDSWEPCRRRGAAYLALAAALDRPAAYRPVRRPAPTPPVALRPEALSVTRVETLRRDPYAIYAERILGLVPAEPIGALAGPREYGTAFHGVMADFARAHTGPLTADAAAMLQRATREAFADYRGAPAFETFVWPRIAGWANAFLAWEAERRAAAPTVAIETAGRLRLRLIDGSVFTLSAIADRIETGTTGRVTIVDYKTGRAPSLKEIKVGFAPQLTLETAMAERGAFPGLGERAVVEGARYVKFETGGTLKLIDLAWKEAAFEDVVALHFEGLVTLLNQFRDPEMGYQARPFPQFAATFNPYDHLARVAEWSAGAGEAEE